jgi:hypothetical protein
MQNMTIAPSKVDLALEALAKLSTEDRKTILEGVKEIIASKVNYSANKEEGSKFDWFTL